MSCYLPCAGLELGLLVGAFSVDKPLSGRSVHPWARDSLTRSAPESRHGIQELLLHGGQSAVCLACLVGLIVADCNLARYEGPPCIAQAHSPVH